VCCRKNERVNKSAIRRSVNIHSCHIQYSPSEAAAEVLAEAGVSRPSSPSPSSSSSPSPLPAQFSEPRATALQILTIRTPASPIAIAIHELGEIAGRPRRIGSARRERKTKKGRQSSNPHPDRRIRPKNTLPRIYPHRTEPLSLITSIYSASKARQSLSTIKFPNHPTALHQSSRSAIPL
jgi:hypothetical protein